MFKWKLIITEVVNGAETPVKNVRSSKVNKKIKKILSNSVHSYVHIGQILQPTVDFIRATLLDDHLNQPPEQRADESPFMHYVTGRLYRNTKYHIVQKTPTDISVNFGYFVDYGKNLELGGPLPEKPVKTKRRKKKKDRKQRKSTAYPIIVPVWDIHKASVFKQVSDAFFNNFKKKFPNQ